ncbi:MAG: hypothetical protein ACKOD1_01825, partial [Sphingomonadales bacterium]
DLPTLAVLENFVLEFSGCLVIISHDRYFMDRLVDHLLIFEGQGAIRDFPGHYSQYRIEAGKKETSEKKNTGETRPLEEKVTVQTLDGAAATEKKPLSYKEKRDL